MKRKVSPHSAVASQPHPAGQPSRAVVGRIFVEGQVIKVLPDGNVVLRTKNFRDIPCRRASSIAQGWLRAAVAVGPVDAEGTFNVEEGSGSIWCVFPGPEHADVAAPMLELVASDRVTLRCGRASVALEKDGSLQVRGRDILTRSSRSARLSGGIVRIN